MPHSSHLPEVPSAARRSRREFLCDVTSCAGSVAFAWTAAGTAARAAFGKERKGAKRITTESWAYVEEITKGVFASISTPYAPGRRPDGTTFSNGGIIAGKERLLVVEGTNSTKGARWQSGIAKAKGGRTPTHVALTHYHPDHSGGLSGYGSPDKRPVIISTKGTHELLATRIGSRTELPGKVIADDAKPMVLDLGGRKVRLVPRRGHTPSDLTIELDDPRVVYCGDLFFHGFFPFFADSLPSVLTKTVKDLLKEKFEVYVPGHGPSTDAKGLGVFVEMLDVIEQAARRAHKKGTPAAKAWPEFRVPKKLGEWKKFRPDVHRFAFEAWERELTR